MTSTGPSTPQWLSPASPSPPSFPRGPTSFRNMPQRSGLASPPATILLDPIGGVSGDMFLAAVLDAWPALGEPVLAAVRAALPAGYEVSLVARAVGALPAAGLAFAGNGAAPTGGYDAFRKRIGEARLPAPV